MDLGGEGRLAERPPGGRAESEQSLYLSEERKGPTGRRLWGGGNSAIDETYMGDRRALTI